MKLNPNNPRRHALSIVGKHSLICAIFIAFVLFFAASGWKQVAPVLIIAFAILGTIIEVIVGSTRRMLYFFGSVLFLCTIAYFAGSTATGETAEGIQLLSFTMAGISLIYGLMYALISIQFSKSSS